MLCVDINFQSDRHGAAGLMRRAVWANAALHDFDQAIFYIAQDDPHAALLVADRIEVAVNGLADMPTGRLRHL
jgi:plasmid stabilization system protein ParE